MQETTGLTTSVKKNCVICNKEATSQNQDIGIWQASCGHRYHVSCMMNDFDNLLHRFKGFNPNNKSFLEVPAIEHKKNTIKIKCIHKGCETFFSKKLYSDARLLEYLFYTDGISMNQIKDYFQYNPDRLSLLFYKPEILINSNSSSKGLSILDYLLSRHDILNELKIYLQDFKDRLHGIVPIMPIDEKIPIDEKEKSVLYVINAENETQNYIRTYYSAGNVEVFISLGDHSKRYLLTNQYGCNKCTEPFRSMINPIMHCGQLFCNKCFISDEDDVIQIQSIFYIEGLFNNFYNYRCPIDGCKVSLPLFDYLSFPPMFKVNQCLIIATDHCGSCAKLIKNIGFICFNQHVYCEPCRDEIINDENMCGVCKLELYKISPIDISIDFEFMKQQGRKRKISDRNIEDRMLDCLEKHLIRDHFHILNE